MDTILTSSLMFNKFFPGLLTFTLVFTSMTLRAQEAAPPPAAPQPANQASQDAQSPDEAKPSGPSVAAPVDPNSYEIGLSDVILIKVWREKELSGFYMVRPDGRISMPLAGDIEANGATPEQLKQRVLDALSKTMVRPELLLEVHQVNSKKFLITGEVNRAGSYPIVTPVTALEAISQAGGLKDFANGKKIFILRKGERIKFNYKDVVKGKNMEQNIELKPGDHIIVP